jgi:hypothetical protein
MRTHPLTHTHTRTLGQAPYKGTPPIRLLHKRAFPQISLKNENTGDSVQTLGPKVLFETFKTKNAPLMQDMLQNSENL